MEAAAGHALSEEGLGLADTLFRETDGNPFFVTELLRHLGRRDRRHPTGLEWPMVVEHAGRRVLPESVREVVGGRVARLGHAAAQVLVTAAVIGRDFDLELLECATRVPVDDLLDILEAAETAALVREVLDRPGRYSFRHALIQHTLHEELGPTRRARAHQHVAEALEELCAGVPGSRVGGTGPSLDRGDEADHPAKAIRLLQRGG